MDATNLIPISGSSKFNPNDPGFWARPKPRVSIHSTARYSLKISRYIYIYIYIVYCICIYIIIYIYIANMDQDVESPTYVLCMSVWSGKMWPTAASAPSDSGFRSKA